MDGGAAGNELAALDRALAAAEIADETARLAHQQHTGGDVPDIQVGLPETIEAARRNPGEIVAVRKSVGSGKSLVVRVGLGGRRLLQHNKKQLGNINL